jgi:hypothetical protein
MKIVVAGTRHGTNGIVAHVLEDIAAEYGGLTSIEFMAFGDCSGADIEAERWAEKHEIAHKRYVADWKKHGKGAGPLRNELMLKVECPDLVLAFPAQDSRGTWDCIRKAAMMGIDVRIFPIREKGTK